MKTQTINCRSSNIRSRTTALIFGGLVFAGTTLGACSSSSPKASADTALVSVSSVAAPNTAAPDAFPAATISAPAILPVPSNPITNMATEQTLNIDSVLVENNLDASGKAASDHLEIALSNIGTTDLGGIEVFYTFTDPTAAAKENYYTKLPADFIVPADGKRIVHFDDTGAPDHFAVNKFSLYYTSTNAMDVSVTVSAKDAAVQKLELKKDAGGAEAAD